jgi:hypothetical protein
MTPYFAAQSNPRLISKDRHHVREGQDSLAQRLCTLLVSLEGYLSTRPGANILATHSIPSFILNVPQGNSLGPSPAGQRVYSDSSSLDGIIALMTRLHHIEEPRVHLGFGSEIVEM